MVKIYNVFFTFFLVINCLPVILWAQYENVWTFGARGNFQNEHAAGLDFNTNPPSIFGSTLSCQMGSATICDAYGNLLFYTEGSYIVRANGDTMPNSKNLTNLSPPGSHTENASQNSLIIPMPDSTGKYYVFSLTGSPTGNINDFGKLFYSVVDMELDNGMGDVAVSWKGILLDSNLTMHMSGVVGDRCNLWVTVASNKNRDIKSFEITTAGINRHPVISPGLGPNCTMHSSPYRTFPGIMRFSSDRKKLVMTNMLLPGIGGIYPNTDAATLFDFNPVTGVVTNPKTLLELNSKSSAYGVAFSPDDSKVYINGGDGGFPSPNYDIYQFDLNAGNAAAIKNSRVTLGKSLWFTEIKAAPNGKLYFHYDAGIFMGTISAPNLAGVACQFVPQAFTLWGIKVRGPKTEEVPLRNWKYGLPNSVPVFKRDTVHRTTTISGNCNSSLLKLKVSDSNGWNYEWNDGSEGLEYNSGNDGGIFWVTYHTAPCVFNTEYFIVEPWFALPVNLGPDTVICARPYHIDPGTPGDVTYTWQDGSRESFFDVTQSGTYWVQVTDADCRSSDTVQIEMKDILQDLGPDLKFCNRQSISLNLKAKHTSSSDILWSNGEQGSFLNVSDTGLYWVEVIDLPCSNGTDSVFIGLDPFCSCNINMPNAFSPNDDGVNDVLKPVLPPGCPIKNFSLSIYNRYGQRVFFTTDVTSGWNGWQNGKPADMGAYAYELQYTGGTSSKSQYHKGDIHLIR